MMNNCIFCNIVNKSLTADIIYEDDLSIALKDINPQAPLHILVIPKKHISSLLELNKDDNSLMGHLFQVVRKVAIEHGIAEKGFRTVINCNREGGQTVFHLHIHILGGRQMHWPPG